MNRINEFLKRHDAILPTAQAVCWSVLAILLIIGPPEESNTTTEEPQPMTQPEVRQLIQDNASLALEIKELQEAAANANAFTAAPKIRQATALQVKFNAKQNLINLHLFNALQGTTATEETPHDSTNTSTQ